MALMLSGEKRRSRSRQSGRRERRRDHRRTFEARHDKEGLSGPTEGTGGSVVRPTSCPFGTGLTLTFLPHWWVQQTFIWTRATIEFAGNKIARRSGLPAVSRTLDPDWTFRLVNDAAIRKGRVPVECTPCIKPPDLVREPFDGRAARLQRMNMSRHDADHERKNWLLLCRGHPIARLGGDAGHE